MKRFVNKIFIGVFLSLVFKFKWKSSSKSSLLLFSTNFNFVLEKNIQKRNCVFSFILFYISASSCYFSQFNSSFGMFFKNYLNLDC